MLCALKFRQLFIELCGIDPFGSVTIASACQKYFRTFLLEENTIAIISQHGYVGNRLYSMESIEWLEWINSRNGGRIQHARNGGEKKIGRYQVDGYDLHTRTVYEYNGCVFHGCPSCTQPDDHVPGSRKKMQNAFKEYREKCEFLRAQGCTVVDMWSCQWKVRREDPDAAPFVASLKLQKPLDVKESFN